MTILRMTAASAARIARRPRCRQQSWRASRTCAPKAHERRDCGRSTRSDGASVVVADKRAITEPHELYPGGIRRNGAASRLREESSPCRCVDPEEGDNHVGTQ